jgi:hypothetical protein
MWVPTVMPSDELAARDIDDIVQELSQVSLSTSLGCRVLHCVRSSTGIPSMRGWNASLEPNGTQYV